MSQHLKLFLTSAFNSWHVSLLLIKISRHTVAKMLHMRLGAALRGWACFVVEQSRLRVAEWRVVVRMQNKLSAAALDGWFVHAHEQQFVRVMAIKVSAQSRSVLCSALLSSPVFSSPLFSCLVLCDVLYD